MSIFVRDPKFFNLAIGVEDGDGRWLVIAKTPEGVKATGRSLFRYRAIKKAIRKLDNLIQEGIVELDIPKDWR